MAKSFFVVGDDYSVIRLFTSHEYLLSPNIEDADLVVFIGGSDLNPKLYGETKGHRKVFFDDSADRRDVKAYEKLKSTQFKVGICRGGQFLNVMNGGKLLQHVSGHAGSHTIYDTLSDDSWMGSSCHHQMMLPDFKTAEIIAYAENIGSDFHNPSGHPIPKLDIEPEIVWYDQDKALCFQGHPEWHNKEDEKRLFNLIGLLQ